MDFDLTKSVETFTFELAKKGIIDAPIMRVGGALDISGSMQDEIRDGSLQKIVDQFGAVAIKFDDNGEIDMWKFDDRCDYIGTWTPDDARTYVARNGIRSRGGTAYSPFINDIVDFMFSDKVETVTVEKKGLFGTKKVTEQVRTPADTTPALILVVTDGEPSPSDRNRIYQALNEAADYPIFFAFLGFSNQSSRFPTLEDLDARFENVGFVNVRFGASDSELYEQLITEKLVAFLKNF